MVALLANASTTSIREGVSSLVRTIMILRQEAFIYSASLAVPSGLAALSLEIVEIYHSDVALNQYREGATCLYHMAGSFHSAASNLLSFSRTSTATEDLTSNFQHTIVRLFSLLNLFCLAELEEDEAGTGVRKQKFDFTTIDTESLDPLTVKSIYDSNCKAEVVCQQIQCLVVDNMGSGVLNVPAPILTRPFQDLNGGMLKYHEALKLTQVLVPFPLKVATYGLLVVNACGTPFIVSRWTNGPLAAFTYTFLQVMVLSLLNFLSAELENPFSGDINDIDTRRIHKDFNVRLLSLLQHGADRPAATFIESITALRHKMSERAAIQDSLRPHHVMREDYRQSSPGTMDDFLEHAMWRAAYHAGIASYDDGRDTEALEKEIESFRLTLSDPVNSERARRWRSSYASSSGRSQRSVAKSLGTLATDAESCLTSMTVASHRKLSITKEAYSSNIHNSEDSSDDISDDYILPCLPQNEAQTMTLQTPRTPVASSARLAKTPPGTARTQRMSIPNSAS